MEAEHRNAQSRRKREPKVKESLVLQKRGMRHAMIDLAMD